MTFGKTLSSLKSVGYDFRVRGFINVEGGNASIANKFFEWCDCTSMEPGPKKETCESCGKGPGSFVSVPSGDGDGIYVVFEIFPESDPKTNAGAFVIFDSGYELANVVRSDIERETVPAFPSKVVAKHDSYVPIDLGAFTNEGVIYFSDESSGVDSQNAVVDIENIKAAKLRAFTFVEPVEPTTEGWAKRWSKVEGMPSSESDIRLQQAQGRAMFEALGTGPKFSLPSFVPRVLLVLDEGALARLDLSDALDEPDWELLGIQYSATICVSHTQKMNTSTIWMNALLAREWDRAAPEVLSDEQAKELLFDVWTWAYQGSVLGDADCESIISQNRYKATPQEIAQLLRRRGMFKKAEEALAQVGRAPESETTGGLTKKSSGLGGLASAPQGARFCSECGAEFLKVDAIFCSSCGSKR
ncbi:MAG: hypothetical protein RIR89_258 [Actinomycetota bacterium]